MLKFCKCGKEIVRQSGIGRFPKWCRECHPVTVRRCANCDREVDTTSKAEEFVCSAICRTDLKMKSQGRKPVIVDGVEHWQ